MIKRYLVAGAAAATLAGGAFAFAANLDVDASTLAAGSTTTDSLCDDLDVTWTTAYNATSHVYEITTIALDGSTACQTETYEIKIDRTGALSDLTYTGTFGANGDATHSSLAVNAAEVLHVTALSTGADVDPLP